MITSLNEFKSHLNKTNEAAVTANPDILKTIKKGDTIVHPNGTEIEPGNYMTLDNTIIRKKENGILNFRSYSPIDGDTDEFNIYPDDLEDFKRFLSTLK